MNVRQAFFHYKKGNSILHKLPPVVKLFLMLIFSIAAFYVPAKISVLIYVLIFVLALVYFKFSFKELFSDNKPAFFYAVMLYLVDFVSNVIFICKNGFFEVTFLARFLQIVKPNSDFLGLVIHVALSLQITSIFFRTTTNLQFNEAFSKIETFITKKENSPLATTLSLTITFIPRIAAFWQRLCYAWTSRGGKENLGKIQKLTPQLFKTSMHEAYQKSLARMNRM